MEMHLESRLDPGVHIALKRRRDTSELADLKYMLAARSLLAEPK